MMSGSSSALLRRRPLRTVRASFPAYGSSLNKFNRWVEPAAMVSLLEDMDHFRKNFSHEFAHFLRE